MLVYQRLSHIHHRSPHEFPVDGIPHLPRPPPTRRLKARGPFLFDDHLLALLRSIDDLKPPSDSCCFSMVNWYIWYICYMMKRHIASFLEFKKWVYNPTYGRAGTTSWNTVTIFHQKIRSVFHNIQRRPSKKKTLGSQTGKISSDSSTWTVTCCTSQTERPLLMARNGVTDEDLDRLRFDLIRCFRFSVSKDMAMIQNVYLSMFICLLWLHVYMMFKTNSMFICHLPCQNKRL